ncbi:uncharacterized protein LOC111295350 [Durio zibethinus]|uniref:Uncharacterized protein LOC111295350 n=1 Tax=Durio zibethinus TaxID=66656 RepID=A0A6P5YVI8_DURZI|nr:uncharacterized protein LOC111295350 [Durio zibethinus]
MKSLLFNLLNFPGCFSSSSRYDLCSTLIFSGFHRMLHADCGRCCINGRRNFFTISPNISHVFWRLMIRSSMVNPKISHHPTICYRPIQPSDLEILEQIHSDVFLISC